MSPGEASVASRTRRARKTPHPHTRADCRTSTLTGTPVSVRTQELLTLVSL